MSGSTGFDYQVVSAAELRRRATEAARARVTTRQAAVRVLRASVEQSVAAEVSATRTGKLEAADLERLSELESALATEEQAISAAAAQARTARARQTLAAEIEALQVALPTLRFAGTSRPAPRQSEPSERLTRRVEAVLEVALGLDESVRSDLQKLAVVVTASDSGQAKALSFLTEMEARVTQAVRRQRAEERRRQRTQELRYEYAALLGCGADVGSQARAIVSTLPGGDPDAAARELRKLEAQRVKEVDRAFALDQATAVLQEMGYAVAVEPSDGTTIAMASGPDWPRHGLKLVFPADAGDMHTVPVALDDTDARDDLAFEESSCGAVDDLRAGLESRGIPTKLTYRVAPGELPVQRSTSRTIVQPAKQKVRRRQL